MNKRKSEYNLSEEKFRKNVKTNSLSETKPDIIVISDSDSEAQKKTHSRNNSNTNKIDIPEGKMTVEDHQQSLKDINSSVK